MPAAFGVGSLRPSGGLRPRRPVGRASVGLARFARIAAARPRARGLRLRPCGLRPAARGPRLSSARMAAVRAWRLWGGGSPSGRGYSPLHPRQGGFPPAPRVVSFPPPAAKDRLQKSRACATLPLMAIAKTPTGAERVVFNGTTMLTVGPTGSQVMQKSTNNRARGSMSRARQLRNTNSITGSQPQIPSAAFSALDELIYALDGIFDQLPPL